MHLAHLARRCARPLSLPPPAAVGADGAREARRELKNALPLPLPGCLARLLILLALARRQLIPLLEVSALAPARPAQARAAAAAAAAADPDRAPPVLSLGRRSLALLALALGDDCLGPLLQPHLAPRARVVPVLDGVVRAAGQPLHDLAPLRAQLLDALGDQAVLLFGPFALLHLRAQVVEPTLAALLAHPARQVRRDEGPPLRAQLAHRFEQQLVLALCPRPLRVHHLAASHCGVGCRRPAVC
eukprot:scaffold22529_cov61-Phaeocystis_antarctica.AAC.3